MSFSPVVTCTTLTKHEVVWTKYLPKRPRSYRVHSAWFQIHQHSSWDIFTTGSFIVVNIDSFQLRITIANVCSSWVDTMLIRNNFPKFSTNLITALSGL